MMVKEMRKAMPQDGPFAGKEMSMFMDMLDETLAERMAESGNMGIAEQMNRILGATDGQHLRSDTSRISLPTAFKVCLWCTPHTQDTITITITTIMNRIQ